MSVRNIYSNKKNDTNIKKMTTHNNRQRVQNYGRSRNNQNNGSDYHQNMLNQLDNHLVQREFIDSGNRSKYLYQLYYIFDNYLT